jgi:hypothetical protein
MVREDTLDRRYREQMIRGSRQGTPSSAGNAQVRIQKPPAHVATARDSFIDERKNHFSFSDKPEKQAVTKSQSISQFMY